MNKTRNLFPALTLMAAMVLIAGCGGGGNGSGNRTLNGLLLDADNAPLSGDTVVYDKGLTGMQTAVTDVQGRYRMVIPHSAITGSDTLTFSDSAGHVIDVVSVTIRTDVPSTSLTTVAPPDPPSQQL